MQNFAYKFVVFILIFFLIFNTSSIAHAHTYEETNAVIKLDPQNAFFLKEDIKKVLEEEKFDSDTLNKNSDSELSFLIGMQTLGSSFLTYSTYPILVLVLGFLAFLSSQVPLISILLFSLIPILYPVLNSFFVYSLGLKKSKHSYLMTLYGSILGSLVYLITITTLVILDSYTITNIYSKDLQEFGIVFILPIFSSLIGSIFYDMSEKPEVIKNETIKTSINLKNIIIPKDFSLAEKIKIQKGSLSFKLADF